MVDAQSYTSALKVRVLHSHVWPLQERREGSERGMDRKPTVDRVDEPSRGRCQIRNYPIRRRLLLANEQVGREVFGQQGDNRLLVLLVRFRD